MNYLSVFSGIESATVAWQPLGWQPVAFAEIDKFPCAVLAHHYPGVPNFGDVRQYRSWPDAVVDVLVGGSPCQSFSVAGLRQGLAEPRGSLTLTYLGCVDRYRPEWFVWENVPGVLSVDKGRAFGAFLGGLAELGYGFAYRILDAQFVRVDGFGRAVPQRRRRVFVVGNLRGWRRAAAVLFERESLSWDLAPRRHAGQGVAAGLGAGSQRSGGRIGRREAAGNQLIAHALSASRGTACAHAADLETYIPDFAAASTLDASYGRLHGASVQDLNHGHSHLVAFGGNNTQGAIDVATACRAHGRPHIDFESETFVAHSLRGEGFDASEDGTGRGTLLLPIAFTQNSRSEVREIGGDGAVVGALARDAGVQQQNYVAVADPYTLASRGRDGGHNLEYRQDGTANAVLTPSSGSRCGLGVGAIVQPVADTLTANWANGKGAKAGNQVGLVNAIITRWRVRRLLPVECERLQGFPDGYTDVPWRKRNWTPDGPRYKALGNAMAVNSMRWLGRRIDMVQKLCEEAGHGDGERLG